MSSPSSFPASGSQIHYCLQVAARVRGRKIASISVPRLYISDDCPSRSISGTENTRTSTILTSTSIAPRLATRPCTTLEKTANTIGQRRGHDGPWNIVLRSPLVVRWDTEGILTCRAAGGHGLCSFSPVKPMRLLNRVVGQGNGSGFSKSLPYAAKMTF